MARLPLRSALCPLPPALCLEAVAPDDGAGEPLRPRERELDAGLGGDHLWTVAPGRPRPTSFTASNRAGLYGRHDRRADLRIGMERTMDNLRAVFEEQRTPG